MLEIAREFEQIFKNEHIEFCEVKKTLNAYKTNINVQLDQLDQLYLSKDFPQETLAILFLLRLCKKIKMLEENANITKQHEDTYRTKMTYTKNRTDALTIHNVIQNPHSRKKKDCFRLIENIFSYDKIIEDLVKYDLLHYTPQNKQKISSQREVERIMKTELDKISCILYPEYIEDKEWTQPPSSLIRFSDTKTNFVFFANTIDKQKSCHIFEIICDYINRIYDMGVVKYAMCEDVNYDFFWILFFVEHN